MSFLEQLIRIDREWLLAINSWNSPFWDKTMWLLTGGLFWIPFYLMLTGYFIWKFKKRAILIILFAAAGFGMSDFVSVEVFKDVFMRLRPSNDPVTAHLIHVVNDYRGGLYGFISSHAANTFMVAVFTLQVARKPWFTVIVFLWALIMCYTRLYLGVHYPGDIICGAIVGSGLAIGWFKIWQKTDRWIVKRYPWWQPETSTTV
jgi:undecaprenyl-diphosphatase